jgi:hypothetical protein
MNTKTDKELWDTYQNYKKNGIKSFASWWGFKLIEHEVKKRKLFDNPPQ